MADKIEVKGKHKHLNIREVNSDGVYYRRVLTPDMDVSGESEQIQETAKAVWTDEIKTSWEKLQSDRATLRKEEHDKAMKRKEEQETESE